MPAQAFEDDDSSKLAAHIASEVPEFQVNLLLGHVTCPNCHSPSIVVQTIDPDPSVANDNPDCLWCLDCGHLSL